MNNKSDAIHLPEDLMPENTLKEAAELISNAWQLAKDNPVEALVLAKRALEQGENVRNIYQTGRVTLCIGYCLLQQHQYETALAYAQKAHDIFVQLNDRKEVAHALTILGSIYTGIGDHRKALVTYESALLIQVEIDDKTGRASSCNNLGTIYSHAGDYSRALEYYLESLSLHQNTADRYNEAMTLNNISNIYWKISDHEKALEYHYKTLEVRKDINDISGQAASYNNIGNVFWSMKDIPKAGEYYHKALHLYEEINNPQGRAIAMMNMANVHSNTGDLRYALELQMKSMDILREIGDTATEMVALMNIGELYFEENTGFRDIDKAISYVTQACDFFEERELTVKLCQGCRILAGFFERLGQFERAYEYITKHHALERKIFNESSEQKLRSMQSLMELDQARKEAERSRQMNEELSQMNNQLQQAYEETLQTSQANITAVIENTDDLIWSFDCEYKLITFNSNFCRYIFELYGETTDPGMYFFDIGSSEENDYWKGVYDRALTGEKFCLDFDVTLQGEIRYSEISFNPIYSEGLVTGAVAFAKDITERKLNEKALLNAKVDIEALIENTTDGIWSVNRDFHLVTFNTALAQYCFKGYGKLVAAGLHLSEILSEEAYNFLLPYYEAALRGERKLFDFQTKEGTEIIYMEISLSPISIEGSITGVVGFARNITERKRYEEALKTSQANISALIENTTDSFWSVNRNYCLLTFNTVFSEMIFKVNHIQLQIGDCIREVLPPEETAQLILLYDRCFAGENITFDFEAINGEKRCFEISLNPIITDGVITGAACSSRDITERKATEDRMREHAALLDIAAEAIIVRDLDTKVTFWNKAAETMYGWTAGEAIGRSTTEFFYNEDTIQAFKKAWTELLFSGQWTGELVQRDSRGKEISVYCRWTLVFDAEGKPKSVLSINSDITEQKSLQQQFYRSQRLESLGTLASGIAHDLNNTLTPILLSVEILRMKNPDDKNSRMLETIETSAKRGAEIVKQVLIFASGVSGERTPLSLADSIREIELIVRKTFSKLIELEVRISAKARPILGDSTQMQQILMNLCVNARDAMPEGGRILIELESKIPTSELFATTPEARSMEYTVLKISDTGSGIPHDILEKIFDPFFTTKEIGSGTGLGLSTVIAIVKSHNGFIKVKSKEGKGASFEIWIPSFNDRDNQAIPPEETAITLSGQGKTILIVDDEPIILQLICYSLEKFGFTIFTADNGNAALLVFKEHPEIELVITDINMPGMDGPTLVGELLLIEPALKFIIMTGLPINNKMDEMKTVGVSSFLSKPFKTNILLKAIGNAVNPEITNISQ